jgi:hypothetical protein
MAKQPSKRLARLFELGPRLIAAAEKHEERMRRDIMLDELVPEHREAVCVCPGCLLDYLSSKIVSTSDPHHALHAFISDLKDTVSLKLGAEIQHGLH